MKSELLLGQIVVVIENKDTCGKLLSDPDLNLDKAVQICLAVETTLLQLKNIVSNNKSDS